MVRRVQGCGVAVVVVAVVAGVKGGARVVVVVVGWFLFFDKAPIKFC